MEINIYTKTIPVDPPILLDLVYYSGKTYLVEMNASGSVDHFICSIGSDGLIMEKNYNGRLTTYDGGYVKTTRK